jgi:hypothetical protein
MSLLMFRNSRYSMLGLRKWLTKKLRPKKESLGKNKGHKVSEPSPAALPFLPSERPGALTPSPSCENVASAINNYGLFQSLPYEIRRVILTEAFGGRTLHIDLSFGHPPARGPDLINNSGATTRHCGLGSELSHDASLPQRWRWFSCVCHRHREWADADPEACWRFGSVEPCDDECLKGSRCTCETHGRCLPEIRFIGIMGWLLTCRQA